MKEQNQAQPAETSAVYQYELVRTDDGSPSVRMSSPTQVAEVMHHSGGALTESLYIYHSAVVRVLELGLPPHILSVGLGIGYNEAITAAHLLSLAGSDATLGSSTGSADICDQMHIASFEIDPVLRGEYRRWLLSEFVAPTTDAAAASVAPHYGVDFAAVFSEVVERIATHFKISAATLHATLARAFTDGRFQIHGALEARPNLQNHYTGILFDAFSRKATPDLWGEPFLMQFLADACAPQCVLATYAATGNLNRALRNSGFTLLRRSGFQGKRESTWAERV